MLAKCLDILYVVLISYTTHYILIGDTMKETVLEIPSQQANLQSHAEKLVYQLKALLHSDSFVFPENNHDNDSIKHGSAYIDSVVKKMKSVFIENDDEGHTALVVELLNHHEIAQHFSSDYHAQQQFFEVFYELQLLLAQRRPENNLENSVRKVIFTSSQHQFDIAALVAWINTQDGKFTNPINKALFNKRDCQLIKQAAGQFGLHIVSKNNQTASQIALRPA